MQSREIFEEMQILKQGSEQDQESRTNFVSLPISDNLIFYYFETST